jgi:hypothetical protein
MPTQKSTIWICYDLGVRGDYENLYTWLDERKAKECGNSVAVLTYKYKDDLIQEIKEEIQSKVRFDKRDRVYVVYRNRLEGKNRGTFIVGGRRASPWAGFAQSSSGVDDEEV